jgi:hypothetical protein
MSESVRYEDPYLVPLHPLATEKRRFTKLIQFALESRQAHTRRYGQSFI